MVETDPTTLAKVRSALDSEIEGAKLEQGESADAVIGIMSEFRNSLGSSQVVYLD